MFYTFQIFRRTTLTYSLQNDPLYTSPEVGSIYASTWDVTSSEGLPQDLSPGTVDVVILVFVMSALHPDEWGQAIDNIQKVSTPVSQIRFGFKTHFVLDA
jgi:tRNAThr (cytosine32-N3)-methyltransferase